VLLASAVVLLLSKPSFAGRFYQVSNINQNRNTPSCLWGRGYTRCAQVHEIGRLRGGSSWPPGSKWRPAANPSKSPATSSGTASRIPTVDDKNDEDVRVAAKEEIEDFLTRDSRQSFIARVYALLGAQLAFTALVVFAFGRNPDLTIWMLSKGRIVPFLSLGLSTIAWITVCCSVRARREAPMKWNLLALFTVGEAISVGFISSFYKFHSVVSAMVATAVASLSVTMYTLMQKNPKYDLSQWGSGLASCGMIFIVYGIIHLLELSGILPQGFLPYSELGFSLVGACLFSFYLAYHTRLIVSGKHTKYQMNSKDYVFGAMSLYSDIINIFIYLLRILGEDREQ